MIMRGINTLHLNKETMCLAMEMWLNDGSIRQNEHLKVTNVLVTSGWFVIETVPKEVAVKK